MKSGDKVRIIKNSHSVNKVGDVGVISEYEYDNDFRVAVKGRGCYVNWHGTNNVELVEETKTHTLWTIKNYI